MSEFKRISEFNRYSGALASINDFDVSEIVKMIITTVDAGGRIYTAGNGGSGNIAEHFVSDLVKGAGGPLDVKVSAASLNANQVLMTAIANDLGYDVVFTTQLCIEQFNQNDLFIGFSVSGTSRNIIHTIDYINDMEGKCILITINPKIHLIYPNIKVLCVECDFDNEKYNKEFEFGVAEGIFSCLAHIIPVRVRSEIQSR